MHRARCCQALRRSEVRLTARAVGVSLTDAPKAGAIPWLLLSAETSGSGMLAGVRFVQRVNTSGGVAPAGACPKVGAAQPVDYPADYIFYT